MPVSSRSGRFVSLGPGSRNGPSLQNGRYNIHIKTSEIEFDAIGIHDLLRKKRLLVKFRIMFVAKLLSP